MQTLNKTPISYYGGKQILAKSILALIPKHKTYVEPFFGGGAVFFAKPKSVSEIEVINDINKYVFNFYNVCRDYDKFMQLKHKIKYTLHCRKTHEIAKQILKDTTQNEIDKAWAFWVQTNMSYLCNVFGGWSYRRVGTAEAKTTHNKREAFDERIYERLKDVYIDNKDVLQVILAWDSEQTFFYLDPPYFNSDCGHYSGYNKDDFANLLSVLKSIKGKFLLSSYPSDLLSFEMRDYTILQKQVAMGAKKGKYKTECFTLNYNHYEL